MEISSSFAGGRIPAGRNADTFRLKVDQLGIGRGGRALVAGLCFELGAGEALVVTGPNGAGKSTLLRTLAGLLPAMAGNMKVVGAGIEKDTPPSFCAHYVGHNDGLKSALSVRENLEFWAAMLGDGQSGASAQAALHELDLAHALEFPAGYLSAGQRRRAALARLLVAQRPLWLLDEPSSALDAASQEKLAALMRAHLAQGGVIVAATHAPLGLGGALELRLGTGPQ